MSGKKRLETLEIARGLAALYVFLHHYAHFVLVDSYPGIAGLFMFGQTAVMVFFIISGFVIHYSSLSRPGELRFLPYLRRRFRRIYPLFAVALAAAYVAQCVAAGAIISPDPRQLGLNLLMLQDDAGSPGLWALPYMDNLPLWSLGYEWWFYLAGFALAATLRGRGRAIGALAISLAGFFSYLALPNPLSLFMSSFVLWWSGAELSREYLATGGVSFRGQALSLASLLLLGALWYLVVLQQPATATDVYGYPFIQFRRAMTILVLLLLGLGCYRFAGPGLLRPLRWARYIAPFSFGLYVIHFPLITVARALSLTGSVWLDFLWLAPVTLLTAYLLEQACAPRRSGPRQGSGEQPALASGTGARP